MAERKLKWFEIYQDEVIKTEGLYYKVDFISQDGVTLVVTIYDENADPQETYAGVTLIREIEEPEDK